MAGLAAIFGSFNACAGWECRAGFALLGALLLLAAPARAQQERPERARPLAAAPGDTAQARRNAPSVRWQLRVDGTRRPWESPPAFPLAGNVRRAARAAVRRVQAQGHYRARLDSAVVDSNAHPPQATFYVRAGPRAEVGRIQFTGNRALSSHTLRTLMDTRAGRPLRPDVLEADLDAILRRYEKEGFPLAQVRVADVRLSGSAPPRLTLALAIEEGRALRLGRVAVESDGRTRPGFVARTAGLEKGAPLDSYDPAALRDRLRGTELFERVGEPELLLAPDAPAAARADSTGGTEAVVRVPLEEKSPATFNLALGYLPPSGRQGGRLVGSGSLALRSPFGAGRTAALRLDRRPGALSRFEVEAADPFVLGTPLRLSLAFEGLQEDSTYGRQRYRLGVGYRLGPGLRVRGEVSREVTRPGIEGSRLSAPVEGRGRRQKVARASSWFGGAGVSLRRLQGPPASPRGGVHLEADVALGRKARNARRVTAAGDTTATDATIAQQRARGTARAYFALFPRQVLALGADAALLLADRYDRSDLFFLGGARSLRGYDEDRFRGHVVGRALAEYRYLLGRRSFAYAFLDAGYARRPALPGVASVQSGWHPGFGVGLQFDSALGLVNASYALNDEDGPTGGRVHLGLAVGV